MTTLSDLKNDLRKFTRPEKIEIFKRFFKTGPGEYGEGDQFLGLRNAEVRGVAKKYHDLAYSDLSKLLKSKIHEERITAVVILVNRFLKSDIKEKRRVFDFYLKNYAGVNNWDLVDISAPKIVGGYLYLSGKSRAFLYDFAKSNNLWKRRIAVMATFYFIHEKEYNDALKIAKILIKDKEDLIHKASGWMLREIGNRDLTVEEKFLKKHYKNMPRTMLRYAIEKFPETKRQAYLKGLI